MKDIGYTVGFFSLQSNDSFLYVPITVAYQALQDEVQLYSQLRLGVYLLYYGDEMSNSCRDVR